MDNSVTDRQLKQKLEVKKTKQARVDIPPGLHRSFVKYQLGRPGRPTLADSIIELAKIGLKHI